MHYRNIQFNNSDFPLLFFLFALYSFKRLNQAGWRVLAQTAVMRRRLTKTYTGPRAGD